MKYIDKPKKVKRYTLIPKLCSRCGNDLMFGCSIYNLPFLKKYLVLCIVCHFGLKFPKKNFIAKDLDQDRWNKFWEEEIDYD